jgi:hypothetical protein
MNREEILSEIEKAKKMIQSSDPNISNIGENRLAVLEVILAHFDDPNGEFDEEIDLDDAIDRVIEWEIGQWVV